MQTPISAPAVWVQTTTGSFNQLRPEGYATFLTDVQQAQVERVRQARMLFDGKHREYFLAEQRTQFDFPRIVVGSRPIQPYFKYNLLALIAQKGTDLLLGAAPEIKCDAEPQKAALQAMSERTNLHATLYAAALSAAVEGAAIVEACVADGEVYLRPVPLDECFPLGPLGPNGQYRSYVRYSVKNVAGERSPIYLLRQITYAAGTIAREWWQLDRDGRKQNRVDPAAWVNGPDNPAPRPTPAPFLAYDTGPAGEQGIARYRPEEPDESDPVAGEELRPLTRTGIDRCTLVWIPNQLVRNQAVSDFDIALDAQDMLNAKHTQLANVLAKHADPGVAFPSEGADDQGNVRAANRAFFYSDPDRIPKYITWDSQLKAAYDDRDFARDALLISTETAPILLGIKGQGAHDVAYKTVKVQAMNSLKKAERKSVYWAAGIKLAVSVAQDLECAAVPGVRYDRGPVGVALNDGFPLDELDQANTLATLRGADLISLDRAVRQLLPDPAAADAELEELADESAARAAQASPPIVFGTQMPGATTGVAQVEQGQAAAAAAAVGEAGEEVSD